MWRTKKQLCILLFFSVCIFMFRNVYLEIRWFINARQTKNEIGKIDFYCQTIQAYVPGSPLVFLAINRLKQKAFEYESKGDKNNALYVYERLRGSLYSIRSFYQPYYTLREDLTLKIAELKAKMLAKTESEEKKWHDNLLKSMKIDFAPSVVGSMVSEIMFLSWIASILSLIFDDFNKKKRVFFKVGGIILSYSLWCIALHLA